MSPSSSLVSSRRSPGLAGAGAAGAAGGAAGSGAAAGHDTSFTVGSSVHDLGPKRPVSRSIRPSKYLLYFRREAKDLFSILNYFSLNSAPNIS